jgi:long-chain acyl-CoA synthetase
MNGRPWLNQYDAGVPHTLMPYPQRTLLDVMDETTRLWPEHTSFIFKGARISHRQLDRQSTALAAALVQLGVQKGDRVVLLLPNCPQAVISQVAAWKAGAIVAPLNPMYTQNELEGALQRCGAETAVVLTPFYAKLKAVQPRTAVRRIIATNIKEYLPPHLRVLFTLLKEKKGGHRVRLQAGDLWLGGLLRQYAQAPRPNVRVAPADPALLLCTGGTTGTPKGAIATHQSLLMAGMQLHAWASPVLSEWQEIGVLAMPLFHLMGNVGVLVPGIIGHYTGALIPDPRDTNDILATIRKLHPTILQGVPTLFNDLLNHPDVQAGKVDLRSLKLCVSGGAPLLAETKKRFEALTRGRIIEGYALTESMMGAVLQPVHGAYKEGSVGVPLPDVELRITDADNGDRDLPAGEVGEILLRAPQMMAGYWQRPAETADALRGGWLHTGDLGYMDPDGYLFIVERKKDVIKASGFQVWPREVEEVLASHPAVAEVGVAGVPDACHGEIVKAWVVLRTGQQATADEIRAHCRQKLAAYKVPKQVEFRTDLPKSLVGKVLRHALVAEQANSAEQAPAATGTAGATAALGVQALVTTQHVA